MRKRIAWTYHDHDEETGRATRPRPGRKPKNGRRWRKLCTGTRKYWVSRWVPNKCEQCAKTLSWKDAHALPFHHDLGPYGRREVNKRPGNYAWCLGCEEWVADSITALSNSLVRVYSDETFRLFETATSPFYEMPADNT